LAQLPSKQANQELQDYLEPQVDNQEPHNKEAQQDSAVTTHLIVDLEYYDIIDII
jgi:methionine synthase II (cobalamin-independent)